MNSVFFLPLNNSRIKSMLLAVATHRYFDRTTFIGRFRLLAEKSLSAFVMVNKEQEIKLMESKIQVRVILLLCKSRLCSLSTREHCDTTRTISRVDVCVFISMIINNAPKQVQEQQTNFFPLTRGANLLWNIWLFLIVAILDSQEGS